MCRWHVKIWVRLRRAAWSSASMLRSVTVELRLIRAVDGAVGLICWHGCCRAEREGYPRLIVTRGSGRSVQMS
jgi:hypothetical protein